MPRVAETFDFRTRIVDAGAKPFAEREFLIVWGKERVTGWTTPDGEIGARLAGNVDDGVLHLGETDADGFVPYLSIPIVRVPPYPPPPEPIEPPPREQEPKSAPIPPINSESEEEWERYQREQKEWEEQEERRQRQEMERKTREQEIEKYEREEAEARRRQAEHPGPAPVPASPPSGAPSSGPEDWKRRADELNRARRETYELHRLQYELFWRLRNLGFLTEEFRGAANYIMRGGDISRTALEDACRRYAHKHALTIPEARHFSERPIPAVLVDLLEHVKTVHERKDWANVNPVP